MKIQASSIKFDGRGIAKRVWVQSNAWVRRPLRVQGFSCFVKCVSRVAHFSRRGRRKGEREINRSWACWEVKKKKSEWQPGSVCLYLFMCSTPPSNFFYHVPGLLFLFLFRSFLLFFLPSCLLVFLSSCLLAFLPSCLLAFFLSSAPPLSLTTTSSSAPSAPSAALYKRGSTDNISTNRKPMSQNLNHSVTLAFSFSFVLTPLACSIPTILDF